MSPEQIPGENDQADMKGTSMDDLPGTEGGTGGAVDAENEEQDADELEDAQQEAAEKREQEGGYQ